VAKGRVLVADPSTRFLERTGDILSGAGFAMVAASEGQSARDHADAGRADVVLTATNLPRLSGYELCRHIKKVDPTIPCVLMFDKGEIRQPTRVWQVGAANFLVRPLKQSELLFAVRDMMAIANLLRQRDALREEREQRATDAGQELDVRARLYQFEFFKKLLAVEIKRARRYHYPLSLMLVGLDARPSHLSHTGAALTRLLAQAVRCEIRDIDVPVTFSTDSVLVVMPHTDQDGTRLVAERLRVRIRDRSGGATASVAVVSTDSLPRATFPALIQAASRALAAARRDRGDRVVTV
jgi:PleD family two-component response regulator